MEEIWKEIPGYDYPYQISNLGNIKFPSTAYKKDHISKGFFNNYGYKQIQLVKNGKPKQLFVHRLVAEIFIPNPDNLSEIDHINRLKDDNRVENLRWVTSKQNQNNRCNNRKVMCIETGIIYENPTVAENILNLKKTSIAASLSDKSSRKSTNGFHWKYVE